jgi:hypothetical protein
MFYNEIISKFQYFISLGSEYVSHIFSVLRRKDVMSKEQPRKQLYKIEVIFASGATRVVPVKAVDRKTAESRALKFNPTATGVKPE